jgi:hypothetical protein
MGVRSGKKRGNQLCPRRSAVLLIPMVVRQKNLFAHLGLEKLLALLQPSLGIHTFLDPCARAAVVVLGTIFASLDKGRAFCLFVTLFQNRLGTLLVVVVLHLLILLILLLIVVRINGNDTTFWCGRGEWSRGGGGDGGNGFLSTVLAATCH